MTALGRKKKKSGNINLLPQEEFAQSTTGRVLTWILSSFRIIVIITEIIVMGAFLSRFYLDTRISDLNDEIDQRKALITNYSRFEEEFRIAQNKLEIYAQLTAEEKKVLPVFKDVVSYVPGEIFLSEIKTAGSTLEIRAVSISELAIAQFIVNLKEVEKLDGVTLSKIDQKPESPEMDFTITAQLTEV